MIRFSKRDDIPSLISLSEASGLFPPDHLGILRDMLTEFFDAGDELERFWLTDDEGDAVGVVFCEPELMTNGTWNLRLIAVAPELQGQGRGTTLLSQTERILSQRGARILIVDTSGTDDFALVREFYRKCGYTEEARIRDFFDSGDDKITFRKSLRNGNE